MGFFKKLFSKNKEEKIEVKVTSTLNFSNDETQYIEDYKSIVLDEEPNMLKAIFLVNNNNKPLETNYPGYYQYKYHIKDTKELHKEFIKQGFFKELDIENNLDTVLNLVTVVELKELLKVKSLKVSGKKLDLIKRLLDSDITKNEIPENYYLYTLTDKAREYLKKYDYLYKLHQNSHDIELEEYIQTKNELAKIWKTDKIQFNDVVWSILNKRNLNYGIEKDYGFMRNNFFNMYELTKSENKPNLKLLCFVVYIDLTGMGDNNSVNNIETIFYKNSPIPPGIAKELKNYRLDDIIENMKTLKIDVPFSYFNIEQMIDIIKIEYNDEIHDIKKLIEISNKPNPSSKKYDYFDISKIR